jgi:hypothetical protein
MGVVAILHKNKCPIAEKFGTHINGKQKQKKRINITE